MAPPNTDAIIQEFEKLNLQQLARTKGHYLVYPETKYPSLENFEHHDPGHRADPTKASILKQATKVFDLTPHIGTEIHGLQLSQFTDQQKNDLALLVAERGVVFFRDQDIDVYQAHDFAKYFGPLHVHNTFGHPEGLPAVHVVYFDSESRARYRKLIDFDIDSRSSWEGWHSDVSYEPQTPGLTLLKIDTLPPVGGDTLWSSGYTAYDRLSPALQKLLEGLQAVHSGQDQVDFANRAGHTVRRSHWTAVHPIIRTHPVTGWKALYVQPGFTRSIVGLSKRESDAILRLLFDHVASGADFQVRFKWEENSVAVWDNRVTSHNAIFDYLDDGRRHGWRLTPLAEKPFYDPNSKSRAQDLAEKRKAANEQ
ncbi:TauD-domain-containing protein [Rhizopus microsporus var. microsporus]|uniref:TauD-domain-containing protein n=2 Tax=Rhizopus microsporus TaxID=58291 RepID=A0A2G4SI05_RHIZD|nr:TauD-domain-containing protein [Rhizopus microsporus ATCC 52813]ORE01888.1 TauD-domain-containing protein [Rhizopus microsporus var. microsporus]PHZ08400.1 TauD-domain-containing protein [Rhizopus microsporus ATCC 52813]